MTLKTNNAYSTRTAQVVDTSFSTTADIRFYSGSQPSLIGSPAMILSGTDPKEFDSSAYSGQLIATLSNWAFKVENGTLIFDPADYPPISAASGTGLIGWCAMNAGSVTTGGNMIGKVTLSGGDGLVHISNDGAGGGTGLNVIASDNISIISFGLKWEN